MKFSADQHYKVAKRLNDRAAAVTDPARKAALARRANRFLALVRLADQRASMLTADELEALRRSAKERAAYFRAAFGRVRSPAEIEAERRGDEWWDRRLKELRAQERGDLSS